MAGHAPELLSPGRRFLRWLADLPDLRLSVYMLILAVLIAAVLYTVDQRLFV